MLDDEITRRAAMEKLLKVLALAAGISVTELKFKLSSAEAASQTHLKMLKLMLSNYNRQVFENEFGRITPLKVITQAKTGQPATSGQIAKPSQQVKPGQFGPGNLMGCPVNMSSNFNAACPNFKDCGSNGGSGKCPLFSNCTTNVCTDQDSGLGGGDGGGKCDTNDCNGQDCGNLGSCGDNECSSQECPFLESCGTNKRDLTGLLNQFRTDPYIQDLMRYFNVTTSQQLASQIDNMIRQRRSVTPAQLQQKRSTTTPAKPKVQ
jgi:hypothetical protein